MNRETTKKEESKSKEKVISILSSGDSKVEASLRRFYERLEKTNEKDSKN